MLSWNSLHALVLDSLTQSDFSIPETLPEEVLKKMHAPSKDDSIPTISDPSTMKDYDGYLFGIPTRYGNFPAQWKTFWDSTGQLWLAGALHGKFAGLFISTSSLGGGQESTAIAAMSTFAHHGIRYVPLGTKDVSKEIMNLDEVHGGSPWGAGTFAVSLFSPFFEVTSSGHHHG